jgi:hypothetical protein
LLLVEQAIEWGEARFGALEIDGEALSHLCVARIKPPLSETECAARIEALPIFNQGEAEGMDAPRHFGRVFRALEELRLALPFGARLEWCASAS